MKERLIELMQLLNCTPTQFANAIGVQRATLQHILNGRNEPSLKIIMAVHDGFPQVDLEWLLYGRGNTFGETSPQKQENNDPANGDSSLAAVSCALATRSRTTRWNSARRLRTRRARIPRRSTKISSLLSSAVCRRPAGSALAWIGL